MKTLFIFSLSICLSTQALAVSIPECGNATKDKVIQLKAEYNQTLKSLDYYTDNRWTYCGPLLKPLSREAACGYNAYRNDLANIEYRRSDAGVTGALGCMASLVLAPVLPGAALVTCAGSTLAGNLVEKNKAYSPTEKPTTKIEDAGYSPEQLAEILRLKSKADALEKEIADKALLLACTYPSRLSIDEYGANIAACPLNTILSEMKKSPGKYKILDKTSTNSLLRNIQSKYAWCNEQGEPLTFERFIEVFRTEAARDQATAATNMDEIFNNAEAKSAGYETASILRQGRKTNSDGTFPVRIHALRQVIHEDRISENYEGPKTYYRTISITTRAKIEYSGFTWPLTSGTNVVVVKNFKGSPLHNLFQAFPEPTSDFGTLEVDLNAGLGDRPSADVYVFEPLESDIVTITYFKEGTKKSQTIEKSYKDVKDLLL